MKRSLLVVILVAGCLGNTFAQNDATPTTKEKTTDQYIGVQLNDLVRQVFNFSSSTLPTYPYLLTYSIDSRKTGWGIRAGVGYTYSSNSTDDGITRTDTKLNDLEFRLGVEKAFRLSEKWSAGAGLDLLFNSNDDNTTTEVHSFDTTTTATKSTLNSYGGGPVGWLRYNVTSKILIGTEASFYYTTGTEKQTVDITQRTFGGGGTSFQQTTETTSNPTVSQANLIRPLSFILSSGSKCRRCSPRLL